MRCAMISQGSVCHTTPCTPPLNRWSEHQNGTNEILHTDLDRAACAWHGSPLTKGKSMKGESTMHRPTSGPAAALFLHMSQAYFTHTYPPTQQPACRWHQ
jgi:hypothetical protein